MKPLFIAVTAIASGTALFAVSQFSGHADSEHYRAQKLIAALPNKTSTSLIWVKLAADSELSDIARELDLSLKELAKLNEQAVSTLLKTGTLLVLPKSTRADVVDSSRFDGDSILTTAPLSSPPTLKDVVEIKDDTSLSSFIKAQGISFEQLKKLNPSFQFSKMLAIGSKLRVAKARPAHAMMPLTSGGASYPDTPSFHNSDDKSFSQSYIRPTKGVFTSGYGWRWGRMHKGIDIANNVGTPILAAKDGIVVYAGWSGGYGYLVEIKHNDGHSTRYAHNSRLLVKNGQRVRQSDRISLMGSTGRSTGPHLHFEIRNPSGSALDPSKLIPPNRA